jgi:aminoglycoside phosphotransferase (APT) family kinase protein
MKPLEKVTAATARKVLAHHFDKDPKNVRQIHGGVTNFVFESSVGSDRYILRISNKATKLQYFMKEQWAVRKAQTRNVPTPEILEVGNDIISMPYMILRRVEGEPATDRPPDLSVYRQMGTFAAAINSIATSDFGHVFDWSRNRLSRCHTWKEFMTEKFDVPGRIETFARHKTLRASNLKKLRHAASRLAELKAQPTLNHGDLRLKNVILDGKGKISAIIDWEHATSNWAPYWELAIALHDLGVDEKEAFLDGYGIGPREFAKMSEVITLFNILHYSSVVEKAAKRKDRHRIAWLQQRLNGAFDFFSL